MSERKRRPPGHTGVTDTDLVGRGTLQRAEVGPESQGALRYPLEGPR
jgi:hypothetical protein